MAMSSMKVFLSNWLLVEPLILLFTMTFMNTVTKQEVYLGKVEMVHPDLTPDALQAETSRFISWVAALETGLTLPILLISGPLSDNYGRKGGLLWSILLAGVFTNAAFALIVFLDSRGASLPLYCYLAPSLIYGLGGGMSHFFLMIFSLVGDLSSNDPETRLRRFTTAEAAISAGVILGFLK